jgi:hypothetical protein
VILDANLGENLPCTLREYFRKGSFYNAQIHGEAMKFAEQIRRKEKPITDSPLKKSIAARMAIVNGMNPMDVHVILGYPGPEASPAPDARLQLDFDQFIENVTGEKSKKKQLEAWRRVLNYSLKEQDFHSHNHPHYH